MPTYKYIAINESGKKVNGVLNSESERAARQQIKASNLTPLSLGKTNRNHFLKVRVSHKQLLFATRQIATLLDSSISIDETLNLLLLKLKISLFLRHCILLEMKSCKGLELLKQCLHIHQFLMKPIDHWLRLEMLRGTFILLLAILRII
jgi:hypothetical protein